jgi:hypothetical protein
LGELMGESIIEHSPESVELRVDFPLARVLGKAFARGAAQEPAGDQCAAASDEPARRYALPARASWHSQVQQKWTRRLPIKSWRSLGIGCPFSSAVDGQNGRRVSICSQFGKHIPSGAR